MFDNEIYKDLYTSLFEERFVQKPSQEEITRGRKPLLSAAAVTDGWWPSPDGKVSRASVHEARAANNQPEQP